MALKTLMVCSVVYLIVGLWVVYSVRKAEFVFDADDFCINHVSQYCMSLSCQIKRQGLTLYSTGCQRRTPWLAQ